MLDQLPYELFLITLENLKIEECIEFQILSKYFNKISESQVYISNCWREQDKKCKPKFISKESKDLMLKKLHLFREFLFESNKQLLTLNIPNLKRTIFVIQPGYESIVPRIIQLTEVSKSLYLELNLKISNFSILDSCFSKLIELQIEGNTSILNTSTLFKNVYNPDLIRLTITTFKTTIRQLVIISGSFPNLRYLKFLLVGDFKSTLSVPVFSKLKHLELQAYSSSSRLILNNKASFPSLKYFSLDILSLGYGADLFNMLPNWPELKKFEIDVILSRNILKDDFRFITDLTVRGDSFKRTNPNAIAKLFTTLVRLKCVGFNDNTFSELNSTIQLRTLIICLEDATTLNIKWLLTYLPKLQRLEITFTSPSQKSNKWFEELDSYPVNLPSLINIILTNPSQDFADWFGSKFDSFVKYQIIV